MKNYYIVYKTTNTTNNKYYIGTHQSNVLMDNYLGSGKLLKMAVQKYGRKQFIRENLFIFNNPKSMFEKERELLTNVYNTPECYNLAIGGSGGFTVTDRLKAAEVCRKKFLSNPPTKTRLKIMNTPRKWDAEHRLKLRKTWDKKIEIGDIVGGGQKGANKYPKNKYIIKTPGGIWRVFYLKQFLNSYGYKSYNQRVLNKLGFVIMDKEFLPREKAKSIENYSPILISL